MGCPWNRLLKDRIAKTTLLLHGLGDFLSTVGKARVHNGGWAMVEARQLAQAGSHMAMLSVQDGFQVDLAAGFLLSGICSSSGSDLVSEPPRVRKHWKSLSYVRSLIST